MGGFICMARNRRALGLLEARHAARHLRRVSRAKVRVWLRDRVGAWAGARGEAGVGQCSGTVPRVTCALVWKAVSEMLHLVLFHELLMVITPETLRRGFMPPCRPATSGSSSRGDGAPIRLSPDMLLELRARMESRLLIAGAPAVAAALLALPKSAARASSGEAGGAGSRASSRKRDSMISACREGGHGREQISQQLRVAASTLTTYIAATAKARAPRSLAVAHGGRPGRAALIQPVSAGA